MDSGISRLVDKIRRTDARRQEVRARILEAGGTGVGNYDAELAVLNREIERYAVRINRQLQDCARRGKSPGKPEVGAVGDPELHQFLLQVQKTCAQLERAKPMGGPPKGGTREAGMLARDEAEAKRMRQQLKQRQRQTEDEVRKTDRAMDDLDRDGKRLEKERDKVERQRERLQQEKDKVARDRDQAHAKKHAAEKEVASLEQKKRQQLQQLKTLRQPLRRSSLEQEVQKTNRSIAEARHTIKVQEANIERQGKIFESHERELEQLDEALKRLDKERERLASEEKKRLEDRKEQLQRAKSEDDGRLAKLDEAERSLRKATSPV